MAGHLWHGIHQTPQTLHPHYLSLPPHPGNLGSPLVDHQGDLWLWAAAPLHPDPLGHHHPWQFVQVAQGAGSYLVPRASLAGQCHASGNWHCDCDTTWGFDQIIPEGHQFHLLGEVVQVLAMVLSPLGRHWPSLHHGESCLEMGREWSNSPQVVLSRDKSSSTKESISFVRCTSAMLVAGKQAASSPPASRWCPLLGRVSRHNCLPFSRIGYWSHTQHGGMHVPNGLHILATERLKATAKGDH